MKKVYVGTNWKMHKTIAEGIDYCRKLTTLAADLDERIQLFIIPPHTHLTTLRKETGERLLLGAQNMHWENEGPFTGEISPVMLKEIGIDLVELGHSERRQYYNENDFDLNKKVLSALSHGLLPLLCIGESAEQKEFGISEEALAIQLKIALKGVSPEQAGNMWIAYEPVWAIGSGGTEAEPDYVHRMHDFIRSVLVKLFGKEGNNIPLLYGGSVNRNNAISYLHGQNVNGLFIGRSAWDLQKFTPIFRDIEHFLKNN